MLEPAKVIFNDTNNSRMITFSQFSEILQKSFSNANGYEEARKIVNDIPAVIDVIDKVYPFMTTMSKSRLTRLKNKLKLQSTDDTEQEMDTDASYTDTDLENPNTT